jgi:hypothetical protein
MTQAARVAFDVARRRRFTLRAQRDADPSRHGA